MTSPNRAVSARTLGAWLLKTDPAANPVADLVATGFRDVGSRCVRRTYRTDLVEPDQPVLLWVSGGDRRTPAGIYAQGRTTGRPGERSIDPTGHRGPGAPSLEVPIELAPVEPPVLRSEILAHPVLARIEVVRMAAGSNPSYLTRIELDQLRASWPQVHVG